MEFRRNRRHNTETLWYARADRPEIALLTFLGMRTHREIRAENAGDRPFDVVEGCIHRFLCDRHLNPLVVLQEMNTAGPGVFCRSSVPFGSLFAAGQPALAAGGRPAAYSQSLGTDSGDGDAVADNPDRRSAGVAAGHDDGAGG